MAYGKPGLNDEQLDRMNKIAAKLFADYEALYTEAREAVPVNSVAFNRLDKTYSALKSLKSYLYNQCMVRRGV